MQPNSVWTSSVASLIPLLYRLNENSTVQQNILQIQFFFLNKDAKVKESNAKWDPLTGKANKINTPDLNLVQ